MICPDDKVAKIKNLHLRSDLSMLQIHTSGILNNEFHYVAFNNILTVVPCILIQSKSFIYQLMNNKVVVGSVVWLQPRHRTKYNDVQRVS